MEVKSRSFVRHRFAQSTFHHGRVLLFRISGVELPLHAMQSLVIKLTISDALFISDPEQEFGWWFSPLQADLTEQETFFSPKAPTLLTPCALIRMENRLQE